jgi:hypothetical protein
MIHDAPRSHIGAAARYSGTLALLIVFIAKYCYR